MLVSSGVSPMAYVLSNYNDSGGHGQRLFKFDPLTFSNEPVWKRRTHGTNHYGHLGLVFGRSESFLYSFSWIDGESTVSLLDTNGISKW